MHAGEQASWQSTALFRGVAERIVGTFLDSKSVATHSREGLRERICLFAVGDPWRRMGLQ
jgi:hypothetical protein